MGEADDPRMMARLAETTVSAPEAGDVLWPDGTRVRVEKEETLTDAQIETMATNLSRLIELGDALAAAVVEAIDAEANSVWIDLDRDPMANLWGQMVHAARAWRAARKEG